ncbi:unnamed protein product [Candidula unifasciata]|uniref:G-protein coupled receptors family 1 profile domain-containing protein n=1 Tax=Candidula unifasciata TaxID=100452 RepID=A0A8S4A213_9EUPU|nr:unnamed protein product [Candidula unifasciata]
MKRLFDNNHCTTNTRLNGTSNPGNPPTGFCEADLLGQIISDKVADIIVAILQVAFTGICAFAGIITNTINITVFLNMGLHDAVNVSLFSLAIGDLLSLVCSLWESICFNTKMEDLGTPIVFSEIEYVTGCWPHVCFVRVTSYATAFITLERCLCITVPLKIKSIITPKRTKVVMGFLFFFVAATSAPEFYVTQLGWKFYPERNRTMLGIHFIDGREKFESVTLVMNNIVLQCVAFVSVVICTVVLIIQLNRKAQWRQQSTRGDAASSGKDKRVIKMISFIAVIFIVCELPSVVNVIAMAFNPQIHPSGINYNMFYVIWSVVYVMESVNSTVNIFVYFNMSSRYKAVFTQIFIRPADTRGSKLVKNVTEQCQLSGTQTS